MKSVAFSVVASLVAADPSVQVGRIEQAVTEAVGNAVTGVENTAGNMIEHGKTVVRTHVHHAANTAVRDGKIAAANIRHQAPIVGQKIGQEIAKDAPIVAERAARLAGQAVVIGANKAKELINGHGPAAKAVKDEAKKSEIESDVVAFQSQNMNFFEEDENDFANDAVDANEQLSRSDFIDTRNLDKAALSFSPGHMLSAVFGVLAARFFL